MVKGATTAPVILFWQGSAFERLKVSWTLSWTQGLASENIGRVSRATTRLGERGGGLQKRRPAHLYKYVTRSHVPPVGLILPLFSTPFRHLLIKNSLVAQRAPNHIAKVRLYNIQVRLSHLGSVIK